MYLIWIIAKNTFREIIRDRILYSLVVFALLIIGISLVLGQLSFAEQKRISANFGLTAIHMSVVIISIFVGSTLVAKEIDKKTIMTLLARPIPRANFLLGKFLGLTFVNLTVMSGLTLVLGGIFVVMGFPFDSKLFIALHGIVLESIVLLSVTIFFGTFATPMMAIAFSFGIFLIGHWIENLKYFAYKSADPAFQFLSDIVAFMMPNLEKFNWRSHVLTDAPAKFVEAAYATGYSLSWFVFFIAVTALIFRRKDFG